MHPDLAPVLERVVRLAARALSVPTASLVLADAERPPQRVTTHGLPVPDGVREALAAHVRAGLTAEAVYEVDGASLVAHGGDAEAPTVRFYAAAPVLLASGAPVGVLEVVGWTPRPPLEAADGRTLVDLAVVAAEVLAGHTARLELEAARRELDRRIDHDPLTGALTRRGLIDRLEHALSLVHRTDATLTVMRIERTGRRTATGGEDPSGSDLEVVARLRAGLRDHDLVGRWGDDAFVVVLQAADGVSEPRVAERLAQDVERPLGTEAGGVPARVSVGIATYPRAGEDALGLLGAAGAALIAAKLRGGGIAEAPDAVVPHTEGPGAAASEG